MLVDRTISDITPKKNHEFMRKHKNFSIGLQYATADVQDNSIESYGIVLEEEEGNIREQLLLDLREDGQTGKIFISREEKAIINHEQIDSKIDGINTAKGKEKLLGEIMFGNDMVKITNKHILLLDSHMQIKQVFENRNIQNFIYADKVWVYALNNRRVGYDNKLKR